MRNFISLLLSVCMITGCASTYEGKGPDYTLTAEAAKFEIENFSMNHSFFRHTATAVEMGPKSTLYTVSSLKPLIAHVSFDASEKFENAGSWFLASWLLLGIAVGVFLGASGTGSE